MFYKMITNKRDQWLGSSDCTVTELLNYIAKANEMRDAQIDAIKTYLFLKIACNNKPLWELFVSGVFNTIDIDTLALTATTRRVLATNPAALALYEYAILTNDVGERVSDKLAKAIEKFPETINYQSVFKKIFYEVGYTDYLFSLPMGAGKTYLMAAFIYLDLYFAVNEPENKVFAHNFIIFAPSGLKSSVIPSLKTIKNFNPSWILPEPAATEIKRMIIFEVLDESKTAKKSNRTKNPNVQKISIHQPLNELMGLIAVTNAEKVILDRIEISNGQISLFETSDDERDKQANELRNLIGKLPSISIFIDEVHHAVNEEIKLRAVVNSWSKNQAVNSVIGFSGTPYIEKAEKVEITGGFSITSSEISNIVYYYPLINGVDNFLKRPVVKISDNTDSLQIVDAGVREFFALYKDTTYPNGLVSKLGIYCGTIEKLEERIYPLVANIALEYGLNPFDVVLKFHRGNKHYPIAAENQLAFDTLDRTISKIRIVLLVQIGKEGWDCRSLTGIILSQEGDCPKNMVLQTSCRCLRQVEKGALETALIYLNEFNGEKLNSQLLQQHHISIKELENANLQTTTQIRRYNRMEYLKLPKIDYYQLRVRFNTLVLAEKLNTETDIKNAVSENTVNRYSVKTQDFSLNITDIYTEFKEKGTTVANFNIWRYNLVKESFGIISMARLEKYTTLLGAVFDIITYEKNGQRYFSSKYRISKINENIRKAFYEKRTFESIEELIPQNASLLMVEKLAPTVQTTTPADYYPSVEEVEKIHLADKGKLKLDSKTEQLLQLARETGNSIFAEQVLAKSTAHPMKDKSFHYMPYKTDSDFEQLFLDEVLKLDVVKISGLEVYYNGDRGLTEFKIRCFKGGVGKWRYIGMYTPDFLIIERRDGKIYRAIIVETKGAIYANDPKFIDKRIFVENEFKNLNNDKFGYARFEYLYLEDTLTDKQRIDKTADAIRHFFKEGN